MAGTSKRPLKVVFCYAHEDELLLNRLKAHLRPLQRQHLIEMWHDREINAGAEWEAEIANAFNTADIILLLVSVDFMDSDYCYDIELQKAIERHRRKEACVIPIILRYVSWQGVFGELQALPTDAKPIESTNWHSLDEALYNVVEGIQKVVEHFIPKSPPHFPAASFQADSINLANKTSSHIEGKSPSQPELPVSQSTLALILGASKWPYAQDQLRPSEAFSNAAADFENYLLDSSWLGLPSANLLNLFDSDLNIDDMHKAIEEFLAERLAETEIKYLLVYIVGHTIVDTRDLILVTRRTRLNNPMVSGIPLGSFALTLGQNARNLRQMLIFDCSFASTATKYFGNTSREGAALFCSSPERAASLISPDERYPMFTEALLRALSATNPSIHEVRSLRMIAKLTQTLLLDTYGDQPPRPEIHSPNQRKMDVADCLFFP